MIAETTEFTPSKDQVKDFHGAKKRRHGLFLVSALLLITLTASANNVVLREDWRETPPEQPITQAHVANPLLQLTLHGPGKIDIKKSHHDNKTNDPFYVWSGRCKERWGVSLKHRESFFDLTGEHASIRLRTRQSGRKVHILIKLSNEQWYVSDQSISKTKGWQESELRFAEMTWREFDSISIVTGEKAPEVSLRSVDEIGFTDLEVGDASKASSRIDWIEVIGETISR